MVATNNIITAKTYRASFVILAQGVILLGYLAARDWYLNFNLFFAFIAPILLYVIYMPFINDDKFMTESLIGRTKFDRVIRHFYVVGSAILIAHSLTGFRS